MILFLRFVDSREIDQPPQCCPAFPSRVLYSFQPPCNGIRVIDSDAGAQFAQPEQDDSGLVGHQV